MNAQVIYTERQLNSSAPRNEMSAVARARFHGGSPHVSLGGLRMAITPTIFGLPNSVKFRRPNTRNVCYTNPSYISETALTAQTVCAAPDHQTKGTRPMATPNDTIPTKVCTRCGKELPATREYFYAKEHGKYGLYAHCRECHLEITTINAIRWQKENPDKQRAAEKRFAEAHPDRLKERATKYRMNNRPKFREASRRFAKRHPDRVAVFTRRRRARKANAPGSHTYSDIAEIFKSQQGLCWWCGKPVGDTYHVDHRIPLSRGGSNSAENLCVSCAFCNISKGAKLPQEWNGRLL